MSTPNRRRVLQALLTGLFEVAGGAAVVLVVGSARAGVGHGGNDETPLPERDGEQPQDLEQRAEQAVAGAGNVPVEGQDEDAWLNAGFRNGAFRNGGFVNGGFRNGGFVNGGGFRNGGFRNGAFRNW